MKRLQQRRLKMESLENRQLLTIYLGNVDVESRDTGGGDLDIYVTNGPGATSSDAPTEVRTINQLWGDWF